MFTRNEQETREELFKGYMSDPGRYVAMARAHKLTLPVLFNRISPEPEPLYPQDAFAHVLARAELNVSSSEHESSANVESFLDSSDKEIGPRETLFWAQLDRDYDQGNLSLIHI